MSDWFWKIFCRDWREHDLYKEHDKVIKSYFELLAREGTKRKELEANIQELTLQIEELSKNNESVEVTPPNWLDTSMYPYKPRMMITNKKMTHYVTIEEPRSIFSVKNILYKDIVKQWEGLSIEEKAKKIWHFVLDTVSYEYDFNEDWVPSYGTYFLHKGDCFSSEEEIWTKEGIKKIKDLVMGEEVLSYDLENKKYVYKPIVKIWEKGKLSVKRVHFRNGSTIDITDNHHLFVRKNQSEQPSIYERLELKNIDLTRWWKRKIPVVKWLPYNVNDMEWLNEDLCFVVGHYIAEGWSEGGHVITSGYNCDIITEKLEENNIPFSEGKNSGGVPIIRFLKSDFKEFLRKCGNNAFNKRVPEEMLSLPEKKLQALLNGYFLGDGHISGEYGKFPKKLINYSTSSDKLAQDIQRIHLQLGKPIHLWKQEHHGGAGKYPIWRLRYNDNSTFSRDYGYGDLSEVSISFIEDIGEMECRDFEVKDTHLVIFRNGIITSQCEDSSLLLIDLCRAAGIPEDRIFMGLGWVKRGTTKFGHAFPIVQHDDGKWYIYESTLDFKPNKPMLFKGSNYDCTWGLINDKFYGKLKGGTQI